NVRYIPLSCTLVHVVDLSTLSIGGSVGGMLSSPLHPVSAFKTNRIESIYVCVFMISYRTVCGCVKYCAATYTVQPVILLEAPSIRPNTYVVFGKERAGRWRVHAASPRYC